MPIEIEGKPHYWMLEVCRIVFISRSTLLRWLKQGVIHEPLRDRRGYRAFSESDIEKIRAEIARTTKT